jgi:hypothetical protein
MKARFYSKAQRFSKSTSQQVRMKDYENHESNGCCTQNQAFLICLAQKLISDLRFPYSQSTLNGSPDTAEHAANKIETAADHRPPLAQRHDQTASLELERTKGKISSCLEQ